MGSNPIWRSMKTLDEMHEAEKVLTEQQQLSYEVILNGYPIDKTCWGALHATATKRVDAFIEVLKSA